ncbi:MAG: SLC45 family MFS transporter [Lachnospiraceae bacterium]|jgi:MFS family permease|nr:SLC45 family MFS transporter [Lachnospiraceae bacterium]
MKLKTGQTIRVGFAFLSICAFWQMYNSIIPLILTNTFAMNETISGAIMAADNVLAIFLLPLFGGISDRCKSKMGRRKPFLLYGTLVSVVLMLLLPILDNRYAAAPSAGTKVLFIVVLGCILVSMGTYRSPAVALMPDVTPKPLRSKANAIINLMGAIGGILYLAIATVMYSEKRTAGLDHVNYLPLFMIVAGIMIVGMLIVLITVDEVGLNRQMAEYEAAHPEEQDTVVDASGEEKLPPEVKRSLGLLLASIALWFISYNAMETWFTTYANRMWGMSLGSASLCLTIATLGAILSYIPVGAIASNIGRKKTILSGVVLMTACFVICFVYTLTSDHFSPILYVIFAFVGMGWAAINVNSLPMVVEMCKGSDIGRFTGYYYTFSMAAQIVTPIVAGTLMNRVGYTTLFPYAAVFMAAAFVTMIQVKHGDSKLITKKGLEAFDFDD